MKTLRHAQTILLIAVTWDVQCMIMVAMKYLCPPFLLLCASAAFAADKVSATRTAEFYAVDVAHGNATFVISPSGETMLLDCGGEPRPVNRIYDFMQQNGIKRIDYLFITHFEDDHMGAAPGLSEKVQIVNFVDHGESVVYDKSDDWWKERRRPWFHVGMGKEYDKSFDEYKAARAKSHHIIVKVGDRVPIKGLEAIVVTGGGKDLTSPLKGAGQPNSACSSVVPRAEDDAEDGQSLGVVINYGKFRFIYLGDTDWNASRRLFCPDNKVGTVDAYVVTHHAQSFPKSMGDYYWGLSCCSPAEVRGLHPRVAILSIGAKGHREGDGVAMETIEKSPGFANLWETEKVKAGGEAGHNAPDDYIANIGEPTVKVVAIKLSAHANGGFEVINTRNGFTKDYPPNK